MPAVHKAEINAYFPNGPQKLQALRDKVEAIKQDHYQQPTHDEASHEALTAVATTATGLLNKAKLARDTAYQKKLVFLADQLKATSSNFSGSPTRLFINLEETRLGLSITSAYFGLDRHHSALGYSSFH